MTWNDLAQKTANGLMKGVSTQDAAEIIKRALQSNFGDKRWIVRRDASKNDAFMISALNDKGGFFRVSKSNYSKSGISVSYIQDKH